MKMRIDKAIEQGRLMHWLDKRAKWEDDPDWKEINRLAAEGKL